MFGIFERKPSSHRPRRSLRPASQHSAIHSALAEASAKRDTAREHDLLLELVEQEPADPRWPHKLGDTLRKLGQDTEATVAYRRAARLYADRGFEARARAMTQLARSIGGRSSPLAGHPSLMPDAT